MSRLDQLLKLKDATPDDPLAHYALALQYFDLERWEEALAAFAEALAIDSNYTAAYYHKARTEIRAGKREEARTTLAAGMECARAQGDMKTEREMRELLETIA